MITSVMHFSSISGLAAFSVGHFLSLVTSSASQIWSALATSTELSGCKFVVPESVHISADSSLAVVSSSVSSGTGGTGGTAKETADSSPS